MIESITEKYVYHSIKMAIQNTLCGEYAARMIAMNNAYDNCLDLNIDHDSQLCLCFDFLFKI